MENNQNNIKFIILRGSHQIGGNCVELVSPNARILIDCGLPLDYDEQDPETQKEIRENARKWLNNCDAIFLSHYHGDHYGLLCEAHIGTKVFTSDETAMLMELSGIFGEDLTQRLDIHTWIIRHTELVLFYSRWAVKPCSTAATSGFTERKASCINTFHSMWITSFWKARIWAGA